MDGLDIGGELRIESGIGHWDLTSMRHVDPRGVDWHRVQRSAYVLHQRFQYDYAWPIAQLRHRLVITPPLVHGDQHLLQRSIRISPADGVIHAERIDEFGNTILDVRARHVQRSICFEAWFVIERQGPGGPYRESVHPGERTLLEPSALTMPDQVLREVAATMMASGDTGAALAGRINAWVHDRMIYWFDATGVRTDAASALQIGRGVCQDYTHIMLTLLRLCGIPARYVSGHLLGEGGSHAWVEALLADPNDASQVMVHAFDPTNGRVAGLQYVTVAVGRDYGDVAPTSGTFTAGGRGWLDASKQVNLVRVDYAA